MEMSPAREPNLPRSSGPQTFAQGRSPISRVIHSRAVSLSYADSGADDRCRRSTATPMRTRSRSRSGENRSRSVGDVNACDRPSTKNATDDGCQATSTPSSAQRSSTCRSEVNQWW
jgi:hypothetical protein